MDGQPLPANLPYFKDTAMKAGMRMDHIRARVLGYLVREAPFDDSRDNVCAGISSACTLGDEDDALQSLANEYIAYFVLLHPNTPRPSPDYLRFRAACAHVADFSGAAQYITSMYRDLYDEGVLANDGSSAMALHIMLSALAC